jgi:ankyrin repeat protein
MVTRPDKEGRMNRDGSSKSHSSALHGDPNEVDSRGRSMIYKSASKGQTEFVEYLVGQGGDVNMPNVTGTTPLHVVSIECFIDFCLHFLFSVFFLLRLGLRSWCCIRCANFC